MGGVTVKDLLIIPIALAAALLWVAWINRPRRPRPDDDSMSDHSKRMSALAPEALARKPSSAKAVRSTAPRGSRWWRRTG
jgi:hypothetical protein